MTTHTSILAWEIQWREKPDRPRSMGSQRIGHDRVAEHKLHAVYFCTGTFWVVPNHCVSFLCPQEPIFAALGSISLLLTMLSLKVKVLVTQSCPTPCEPMNCSPPGSSVHGILQARMQEWVAMLFFKGICPIQGSNPGLPHHRQILYYRNHQGSPGLLSAFFFHINLKKNRKCHCESQAV